MSVQEVHRRLISIYDRQHLAVQAEGEPQRAKTAQRLLRGDQFEAAVIEPDFSTNGRCGQPSVIGEGCAIAFTGIGLVAERFGPILIPVEDAQTAGAARCSEVTAISGEDERTYRIWQASNPCSHFARVLIEQIDWKDSCTLPISASGDDTAVRGNRGPDDLPDGAWARRHANGPQ